MKRFALFLLLAVSLPLHAQSADPAKEAKVREYLALIHVDRTMDQVMDNVRQQVTSMTTQMIGGRATPQQKEQLATFQNQIFELVNSRMGWKALEPEYIELYAQSFTDEELDAIIAFYKSPAGVSMIAKTPELTQKAMALSQRKAAEMMPEVQKMVRDFAASAAQQDKQYPSHKTN